MQGMGTEPEGKLDLSALESTCWGDGAGGEKGPVARTEQILEEMTSP